MPLATGVIRLALQAFRSYDIFEWSMAEPHAVALIGPNGIGKTNLLEALSLLTPGRGLRRASAGVIQADHTAQSVPWAVAATLHTPTGPLDVTTGRASLDSERRLTKISGAPLKTQAELAEYIYALWLTPQMDGLFLEGESGRRRFLDRLVLGLLPSHGQHVLRYEKALRERHRLFEESYATSAWFEGIEQSLAREGVEITRARLFFLEKLHVVLQEVIGPFPQASLCLEGEIETFLQTQGIDATYAFFLDFLKTQRGLHQKIRQTPWGPHKSKVRTFFPGDIAAEKCSTGQQKILLISIILAACRLQARGDTGEKIFLLLLDDVVAHLDENHRDALFETLAGLPFQVWMTGTDTPLLGSYRAEVVCLP